MCCDVSVWHGCSCVCVLNKCSNMNILYRCLSLVLVIVSSLLPLVVQADERLFTYSYEADVLPEGGLELEQWATLRAGREGGDYARWDFRTELEYGLTSQLTAALYLNFTDLYSSPREGDDRLSDESSFDFRGVSSEWKWQLLNPYVDPVGFLLYGEATFDSESIELEEKIVFQKNIGGWTFVCNAVAEQEWEFEHGETEREATVEFTGGASYKLSPQWSLGLEARNVQEFADTVGWSDQAFSAWFVGPALHYGAPTWWATLTVLPQVTSERVLDDRERVEARLIVGFTL